jgi:hypothetical protein
MVKPLAKKVHFQSIDIDVERVCGGRLPADKQVEGHISVARTSKYDRVLPRPFAPGVIWPDDAAEWIGSEMFRQPLNHYLRVGGKRSRQCCQQEFIRH